DRRSQELAQGTTNPDSARRCPAHYRARETVDHLDSEIAAGRRRGRRAQLRCPVDKGIEPGLAQQPLQLAIEDAPNAPSTSTSPALARKPRSRSALSSPNALPNLHHPIESSDRDFVTALCGHAESMIILCWRVVHV